MKRFALYVVLCTCMMTFAGLFSSCSDELDGIQPVLVPDGERIVLDFMPMGMPKGRALTDEEVQGIPFESEVEKLDIFVFDKDGKCAYHQQETYDKLFPNKGTIVLNRSLKTFIERMEYTLHLVANAGTTFDAKLISTLDELRIATERNEKIHLTTVEGETRKRFVMYGVSAPVMLNPVGESTNREVTIELVREAAKIILELTEGEIKDGASAGTGKYFTFSGGTTFRLANLQATARYVYDAQDLPEVELIDTEMTSQCVNDVQEGANSPRTVTIVTYAYPNNWKTEVADNMTHLVVKLPYVGTDGNEITENYYSIPITDKTELEANHIYKVSAVINAAGSGTDFTPKSIAGEYKVMEWVEHAINIDGDAEPHYLTFDKDYLLMRGIRVDSIGFASSHEMVVELKEAYFYNKYGERKDVNDGNILHIWENYNKKDDKPAPLDSMRAISDVVTWKDYHGDFVKIECPMPLNNLPHYVTFTVKHKDCGVENCNLQTTITLEQYPTEYISSYFGWHSYRDDFINVTTFNNDGNANEDYDYPLDSRTIEATTIENLRTHPGKVVRLYKGPKVEYSNGRVSNVDPNVLQWSYRIQRATAGNNSGPGFFKSKVAKQPEEPDNGIWWSNFWSNGTHSSFTEDKVSLSQFGWRDGSLNLPAPTKQDFNPRIYQVSITSSKKPEYMIQETNGGKDVLMDYDVTQPRLTSEGYTDTDASNLRLVSPVFAVASRLGAVTSGEDITIEDRDGVAVPDNTPGLPKGTDGKPTKLMRINYLDANDAINSYDIAKEHCARYVEVYRQRDKNGNLILGTQDIVLDNWRLPTPAELRILIYYQGNPDANPDAMDYQLPANYFWTADPKEPIYNWNHTGNYSKTDVGLRCVHDMTKIMEQIQGN